jgi:hypothetical protein
MYFKNVDSPDHCAWLAGNVQSNILARKSSSIFSVHGICMAVHHYAASKPYNGSTTCILLSLFQTISSAVSLQTVARFSTCPFPCDSRFEWMRTRRQIWFVSIIFNATWSKIVDLFPVHYSLNHGPVMLSISFNDDSDYTCRFRSMTILLFLLP